MIPSQLYDTLAPRAIAQLSAGTQYIGRAREDAATKNRPAISAARRVLEELSHLNEGWDGYGGLPVATATRLNAWQAFSQFCNEGLVPEVTPNSNGTISFEWSMIAADAYFEIGKTRFSMYIKPSNGDIRYFDGNAKDISQSVPAALSKIVRESVLNERKTTGNARSAASA